MVLQERAAHGVCDPRRGARHASVAPPCALTYDEKRPPVHGLTVAIEEPGDVGWVVLPITVEDRDQRRSGKLDARVERSALAGITAVADDSEFGHRPNAGVETCERVVGALVIYDHDLERHDSNQGA